MKVTIKVLNAKEYEEMTENKMSDTAIFDKYCLKVAGLFDENNLPVPKERITTTPGCVKLVNEVALQVLKEAMPDLDEKKL